MELTEGTVITVVLGVIVLAVATVAMTVNAVFNALNARGDAIMSGVHEIVAKLTARMDAYEVRMEAHEKVVAEQLSSIKAAVAVGTEEHKAWQNALKETNERLAEQQRAWQNDLKETNERLAEQSDKSNDRIDKLLIYLLNERGGHADAGAGQ